MQVHATVGNACRRQLGHGASDVSCSQIKNADDAGSQGSLVGRLTPEDIVCSDTSLAVCRPREWNHRCGPGHRIVYRDGVSHGEDIGVTGPLVCIDNDALSLGEC